MKNEKGGLNLGCYLKNLYVFDCLKWTFNLPDFQDRVIQGAGTRGNVGTYKVESLPNIKGNFSMPKYEGNVSGSFYKIQLGETNAGNVNQNGWLVGFDASISSSTYQNNAPVQQNAILIQCCIKY